MLPGCERLDRRGGRRGRAGRCVEVAGWTAVAVAGRSSFPPSRGDSFYSTRAAARGASCSLFRSVSLFFLDLFSFVTFFEPANRPG